MTDLSTYFYELCSKRKCDLLWRNREQVGRQMFLTCTQAYDQYRHYSAMHSAKHNDTQHWRCAFMSESFYNYSQGKLLLFKWSSTVSR